jgi:glycosyltransferase involved in cell wall biosynthesis
LPEGRKTANIQASSGVIRGIPAYFILPGIVGAGRLRSTRMPQKLSHRLWRMRSDATLGEPVSGVRLVGMSRVTIAMVVRNAVEAFADTFQSIEEQTYPNIEIIVVDGGSTDGTLELIREREARIAHWISEPDEGPYDGMNKAARLANGRWILFMNAGDFFYTPEAVEIALNGAPEQADFIIGHHIYRSIEGMDELHKASDFEDTWRALIAGQLSSHWLSGVPCHQATFTRTSMLTAEGGYNYRKHPIAADHEFMYRMRSRGGVSIIAMKLSRFTLAEDILGSAIRTQLATGGISRDFMVRSKKWIGSSADASILRRRKGRFSVSDGASLAVCFRRKGRRGPHRLASYL